MSLPPPCGWKSIIFGTSHSRLRFSLELNARHIPHDLPQSLCNVLNLIVQEYRLDDAFPLKGVDPVRNIPSLPKDGWITEKGILCRASANMTIRNCNVSLHQGGSCLRGDKCTSKRAAAHPMHCEIAQQADNLHGSHPTARNLDSWMTVRVSRFFRLTSSCQTLTGSQSWCIVYRTRSGFVWAGSPPFLLVCHPHMSRNTLQSLVIWPMQNISTNLYILHIFIGILGWMPSFWDKVSSRICLSDFQPSSFNSG